MIDDLHARLAAFADATDDSSWADVVERATALRRRKPRLPVALAAAAALAVVVATPAVGLRGKIVRLFAAAEPAPQRIQKSFAGWNDPAARGLGPQVRTARAIKVLEAPAGANGKVVLWLAPLERGGFCTLLSHGGGGECNVVGDDRLSVTVSLHGISRRGTLHAGPVLLDGYTRRSAGDSLLLRFEDGESAKVPLVWVSAPVDAGFFAYAVPPAHWRRDHLPTTLSLLSSNGDELDRRAIHGIPPQ